MLIKKTKDIMKNPKFNIGDYTYGEPRFSGGRDHLLLDELIIGKFCSIGPNVEFLVEGYHHNVEWFTTYPLSSDYLKDEFPNTFKNTIPKLKEHRYIRIGNDVWIGKDVKILSNVSIGDGAVIGTNAVVTKDIPPYSIAVGCPIKVIKYRFNENIINYLLELKWWNWNKEKIDKYGHLLCNGDFEKLKTIPK